MNVSIVIPNYNGEELLRENLPKVFDVMKSYKGEWEIIVVDDGSTDNSLSVISNNSSNLKLLKNEKNLGFSPTVNKGVREAKGDIVYLLNNDAVPERGFLDHILSHFKDEKVFAVACMDKSIENGKTVLRGRGIGKWQRGFLVHAAGDLDKNNTLWASGGSSAFRRSLWEKIDGMNELYAPFYWEDIDLSYRAQKCGYKVVFEKRATVVHEHERGIIRKKFTSSHVKKKAYRHQFYFVWINATDRGLLASHFLFLPYHFLAALKCGDKEFLQGFFSALPKFFKCRRQNKLLRKLFVVSDKDVVEPFAEEFILKSRHS